MDNVTPYAIRFWSEDRNEIVEFAKTQWSDDSIDQFLTDSLDPADPDGSRVILVEITEADTLHTFGLSHLETFNQYFEWRDRDDTMGPFTKAHRK